MKASEPSYKRALFSSKREGNMHRDIDRKQARVA